MWDLAYVNTRIAAAVTYNAIACQSEVRGWWAQPETQAGIARIVTISDMQIATQITPLNDANRLGLLYRHEAAQLPWRGPIVDVHTHVGDVEGARLFFEVADLFGVQRIWTMTQLENIDAITAEFGDRVKFIAIPNYMRHAKDTFTVDFLKRIEQFAEKGSRVVKFWAAPRGHDFDREGFELDSPWWRRQMDLARSLGMMIMTHVSDPDTWFASHYLDHRRYGTKAQQYEPLERMLDEYHDVPWLAAHMAGDPEHLDHLQYLLDRYPHLYLDTSATKWLVRELSKHAGEYRAFCRNNPGRILFGTDNVANKETLSFDLYASRFWALRALHETDYAGPSPIVDPDLSMLDPSLPRESTATRRGAAMDPTTLQCVYHDAAVGLEARSPQGDFS